MPSPEQYDAAWEVMNDNALMILRTSEIQHGLDPAEGEQLVLLKAGIAMGIAAATSYYKNHPEMVPEQ